MLFSEVTYKKFFDYFCKISLAHILEKNRCFNLRRSQFRKIISAWLRNLIVKSITTCQRKDALKPFLIAFINWKQQTWLFFGCCVHEWLFLRPEYLVGQNTYRVFEVLSSVCLMWNLPKNLKNFNIAAIKYKYNYSYNFTPS